MVISYQFHYKSLRPHYPRRAAVDNRNRDKNISITLCPLFYESKILPTNIESHYIKNKLLLNKTFIRFLSKFSPLWTHSYLVIQKPVHVYIIFKNIKIILRTPSQSKLLKTSTYFVFAHFNSFDLNILQNKQISLWSLRLLDPAKSAEPIMAIWYLFCPMFRV